MNNEHVLTILSQVDTCDLRHFVSSVSIVIVSARYSGQLSMNIQGGHWVDIIDHLSTTFKISLDYYTLQNSWSFPFNWISKDFFRRSKNSWKNKNRSIFGHSVRVWSIFSKTPVAALHTNIGREKWLIYCSCLQFSNCEMDYCVS